MSPSTSPWIGNRYQLHDKIGEGSMGAVFSGIDMETGEVVAIKRLKPQAVSADPNSIARFQREGELLQDLRHPNIVQILHTDFDADDPVIVMAYLSGGSLKDLIEQRAPLPVDEVLSITLEVADALTRAHHLNVIHRDLKPANILLDDNLSPCLTDFGLAHVRGGAHLTDSQHVVGTLPYLSPETINGMEPDEKTDIWAFGVMLYEMLTGIRPFRGERTEQVMRAILMDFPEPDLKVLRPDVPVALVDLIYRMLEKDPLARMASVRRVGAELEDIAYGRDRKEPSMRFKPPAPDTTVYSRPKHNLPVPTTSFVGRESELEDLQDLLNDNAVRLITICAPGGMGKTRLSMEVARRLLAGFEHGVWFVPLSPVNDAEFVESAIAKSVNFQFYNYGTQREQILNFFRAKSLLLILDNFEHLLEGANLVADILAFAPDVKIIVTSRESLNLSDEWVYAVRGMAVPDVDSASHIEDYSAVRLFVERARRVKQDFSLETERACVVRILSLVEGMPLGIEMAATWLKRLPCQRIADEIAHNLDFLSSKVRDSDERHRSMRAVFDHSWQLLNDEERETLARASVFQGGFTEAAAQAVTGASFWTFVSLVDKSLLRMDDTGRYDMHRLLQQYAAEHLRAQPNIHQIPHERHCDHYLGFVAEHQYHILDKYYKVVLADLDNIQMAWQWAVEHARWDMVERSMEPLVWYYDNIGRFGEGNLMVKRVIDTLHSPDSTQQHAILGWALGLSGFVKARIDDDDQARDLMQQGAALLRRAEPGPGLASMLRELAFLTLRTEPDNPDFTRVRGMLQESQAIGRQIGSTIHLGAGLFYEGLVVHVAQGDFDRARQCYEDALNTLDDSYLSGFALTLLGDLERLEGNYEMAVETYRQALACWPSDRMWPYAQNLRVLAISEMEVGSIDEGRQHFEESLAFFEDIGWISQIGFCCTAYGLALWRWGAYGEARHLLTRSLELQRELGPAVNIANALVNLGHPTASLGVHNEAWGYYVEALRLIQDQNSPFAGVVRAQAVMGLASILGQRDHLKRAVACLSCAASMVLDNREIEQIAARFLAPFEEMLSAGEYSAAIEKGQSLELETVISELLAIEPPK